jgi:hypothetical protein
VLGLEFFFLGFALSDHAGHLGVTDLALEPQEGMAGPRVANRLSALGCTPSGQCPVFAQFCSMGITHDATLRPE